MAISLTADQHAWFEAHVARGEFPSIEAAAIQLIDERIAERAAEADDDLAWAKPYVDQALVEIAGGRTLSLGDHEARMDAVLALLRE